MKIENIIFAACSAFKPETGSPSVASGGGWFQTFPPYGRYPVGGIIPGAEDDAEFVFDEAAAKSIIAHFREDAKKADWPGILVDREHFSADREKTSDAMAWAKDIRQEADGSIWTRWEFTAPGKVLWEGKVLVNRSPLFACAKDGKRYHPVALKSIGMTNTPHFTELSTLAAARAAEVNNNEGEIHMQKILEALGLAEGASEDEALSAIQGLKDKASAAEAKATEAETAKTEAEKAKEQAVAECRAMKADAFVAVHKDQIADTAAAKAAYIANPELAEQMIAACKAAPAKPAQQILAPARSAQPPKKSGVMEQLAACKSAKERCEFVMAHAKEIAEASK